VYFWKAKTKRIAVTSEWS